jgi:ribosomal protein S18 acetylase RimI-like enzyme
MFHYYSCKWTIFLLLIALPAADGFSLSTTLESNIQVTQVTTPGDWFSLADVRYDEWIKSSGKNGRDLSRDAFRYATINIYDEERPEAMPFLARKKNMVVGAAELSPMELVNALSTDTNSGDDGMVVLYVTDVVTDRNHRRQGIAATLMNEMEAHAVQQHGAKYLVLNVAPDNVAAQLFYEKLGYTAQLPLELSLILNVEQLAANARTDEGHLLLSKKIT